MKKFKKRFLKFSCIISAVMVLTFTALSPFTAFAEAVAYPEYKIPIEFHAGSSYIAIDTLTGTTGNGDPSSATGQLNYRLNGVTWFSELTPSQRWGSYWNDHEVKLQWYLGRMTHMDISLDTNWDAIPPKLSRQASYDLHISFDLDLHNYKHDGPISLEPYLVFYYPDTEEHFVFTLNELSCVINTDDDSPYYDSSTGHFELDKLLDFRGLLDGSNDIIIESIGYTLTWLSWTSSAQGGSVSFKTSNNYLLPYYDNAQDLPAYPDYDDNEDLNIYNDKVGEVDSFVEGNLDNISNMFTNGLTYLTGSFRNTMLYVGSVLTTLTNTKFLSVLVPISLSIGFIAFLLVGASFVSKSFKSKKGGG